MDKDQLFVDEAIRDTLSHDSVAAHSGEFTAETIVVFNGFDSQATFQLQGCIPGTGVWLDIGAPFNVPANTNEYETVSDYFPCYRIQASCTVAPTSGNLNVWIIKSKGR